MIAVADASPLCYQVFIGEIDLLPNLFLHVAAASGHSWAASSRCSRHGSNLGIKPAWVARRPRESPFGNRRLEKLQRGEQAAILLAESMKADIISLDEKATRRVAAGRGLRATGLLGVLGEAANLGMVELALAIDRLSRTNFRSSPALLKASLDRFGER
jgi:predicted nucleic acid-binding protein